MWLHFRHKPLIDSQIEKNVSPAAEIDSANKDSVFKQELDTKTPEREKIRTIRVYR